MVYFWGDILANQVIVQELKSGQFVITVPRSLAEVKGWKKGTKLEYLENRYGELTLREVSK